MEKKKLVILSDYGLDDAVAGAYLLGRKEIFSAIDIVAVAGNVSYAKSLKNAKKLVSLFLKEGVEARLAGSESVPQFADDLPDIHGTDGMGDIYSDSDIDKSVDVIPFDDYIASLSDGFILLSLGPLTVTKIILEKFKPSLTLIMAGVVNEVPNYNGMEFNEALDVAAYEACLKYPHLIATLDTCRHKNFNLAGTQLPPVYPINRFINISVDLAVARHPTHSYIYDFIASLYLTHPQIFTVETVKDSRGNTLNQLKLTDETFLLSEFVKGV